MCPNALQQHLIQSPVQLFKVSSHSTCMFHMKNKHSGVAVHLQKSKNNLPTTTTIHIHI